MKWPRWLPRLMLAERAPPLAETGLNSRMTAPVSAELSGTRDLGNCEACGRSMQARTRREEFRGRVDCNCGFRNHVEFREVRSSSPVRARHVTVTTGRRFEAARQRPDLRLDRRFGICPSCTMAVRLLDSHIVAHDDVSGSAETMSYYCTACRLDDDSRRGRLTGHDGAQVVDHLRFQSKTIRADEY